MEFPSESRQTQSIEFRQMRIHVDRRKQIDVGQALIAFLKREPLGENIAIHSIIVGRIELGGPIQRHGAFWTRADLCQPAEFAQCEPALELERSLPARILERSRSLDLRMTDAEPKAGDLNGVVRNRRVRIQ